MTISQFAKAPRGNALGKSISPSPLSCFNPFPPEWKMESWKVVLTFHSVVKMCSVAWVQIEYHHMLFLVFFGIWQIKFGNVVKFWLWQLLGVKRLIPNIYQTTERLNYLPHVWRISVGFDVITFDMFSLIRTNPCAHGNMLLGADSAARSRNARYT